MKLRSTLFKTIVGIQVSLISAASFGVDLFTSVSIEDSDLTHHMEGEFVSSMEANGTDYHESRKGYLKSGGHTSELLEKLNDLTVPLGTNAIRTIKWGNGVTTLVVPKAYFGKTAQFKQAVGFLSGAKTKGLKTLFPTDDASEISEFCSEAFSDWHSSNSMDSVRIKPTRRHTIHTVFISNFVKENSFSGMVAGKDLKYKVNFIAEMDTGNDTIKLKSCYLPEQYVKISDN